MKKIIFLLLISTICFSQNGVDSLSYYSEKKEFDKAINYTERWIKSINFDGKEKDIRYLSLVCHLISFYSQNDFKYYSKEFIETLENNLIVFENNIDYYRDSNYFLGRYYFLNDKYEIAQMFFNKTKELSQKKSLEDICYLNTINYLNEIDIYFYKANIFKYDDQKTIENIVLLKKYFEEHESKKSEGYVISINNLGLYYLHKSEFEKAEKLLLEAHFMIEKNNYSNLLVGNLDNLIQLNLTKFNFAKADFYNEIILNKIKKDNVEYLTYLTNKAFIKSGLGNYNEARNLYDECIRLAKELYGLESVIYGTLISNSVDPYLKLGGSFQNAEKLYLIDYEIKKKHNGINHPKTAMCYTRLGSVNMSMNKDEKALEYFNKALNIFDELHIKNIEYSILLTNIAVLYSLTGNYDKAEKFYFESYTVKSDNIDKFNISKLINIDNLCAIYLKNEKINEHNKHRLEYFEILKQNIFKINSYFGEKESISYLNKILKYSTYLSFLNFHPNKFSDFNIPCYENQLLLKNLTLRNQQRIKNSIAQSNNTELKDKYEQFIANKKYLTKIEEQPLDNRPKDYETLKSDTENLEKDITRLSSEFANAKKNLSITWQDVQQKLKTNEVTIDLVSFDFYDKKWTGEVMYGAFVITKDSKFPKYISLFEEKALSKLLERNNLANDTIQANAINKQYIEKELAQLFFDPLKNELKNKEVCYLSLSGLAHQVNFTALDVAPFIENKKAMKFHILNSPSELLSYQSATFSTQKNMEFLLFGGINYEKSSTSASKEVIEDFEQEVTSNKDLETRSGIEKFGYLIGTNTEVKQIEAAAKNKGFATQLFTETNATEEQIKSLSGKTTPFVLHLATHGFFFPNPDKELPKENAFFEGKSNLYKMSDDPMFRSGLLLAGANKFWRKPNNEKIEDGILTANEISNLDLSACQLVVLSACETGLGQIKGSEGVFGLQRAFKMAGAKNIIMSLWKVPDAQTSELFQYFYSECFNGKSVHDAFQSAQEQMKSKYDPYFWAGFILLE